MTASANSSVSTMISLGLLFLLATAWGQSHSYSVLSVYGLAPRQLQTGFFNFLQPATPQRYVTLRDVYERPIVIITPGSRPVPYTTFLPPYGLAYTRLNHPFSAYYARNGLRSVVLNDSFRPLHKYFLRYKTLSGLVFTTDGFPYHSDILQKNIAELVFPDNFNVRDLLQFKEEDTLFLFVSPEDELGNFQQLIKVASFIINEHDVVPNSFVGASPLQPNYEQGFGSSFVSFVPLNFNPFVHPTVTDKPTQNETTITDKIESTPHTEPPKVDTNHTNENSNSSYEKVHESQDSSSNVPANIRNFSDNSSGDSHNYSENKQNTTTDKTPKGHEPHETDNSSSSTLVLEEKNE